MRGRVAAARRLLDAGARRVPRKKGADTLVHYAVSGGSRELMAMALELFREVDVLGRDHRTALMQACADQPDLVGPLLDRGAEVNAKARFGQTPLSEAAGSGNLALVKELLHRGADVNRGNQSLLAACQGGVGKPFSAQDRVAILGLLLDRGANIEMKDERGYTALMWAAARGESEVGLFLLERGANPKVKSKDGETALDLAKRSKSRALVSRLMV
jgi:ankyrin repeat protein